MIRVLLADDQALIRAGFRMLLDATSIVRPSVSMYSTLAQPMKRSRQNVNACSAMSSTKSL